MPLKIVFSRPKNWSRLKPRLLKHYYHHQSYVFFCSLISFSLSKIGPTFDWPCASSGAPGGTAEADG